jgi:3',5'-cyclic AMP phosphodiesterase CpdA
VTTLLHISDLHFGPPYVERAGESLLRIVPQLAADAIVISGDFTQRAKPEQFEQARAFLDRLPAVPQVRVPGNHDVPLYRVWERLTRPRALYQQHIQRELNTVMRVGDAIIVALDSSSPRTAITEGWLDAGQLAFCEESFRDVPPTQFRIVVAHHPLAPAPERHRVCLMRGAKSVLQRFSELRVDLVLGGHLHRSYVGSARDVVDPWPDDGYETAIVQCGTTTSRRGRGRERHQQSFNLLRLDGDRVSVTRFRYSPEADEFLPRDRQEWSRSGSIADMASVSLPKPSHSAR